MTNSELRDCALAIIKDRGGITFDVLLRGALGLPHAERRRLDRTLQRLRKAGRIRFAGAKRGWVAT